jgi:FkbM family methyltransferase
VARFGTSGGPVRAGRELATPFWHAARRLALGKGGTRTRTALNGLDDRLEAFIPSGVGYYVELGANDGIAQSNTYWLEAERGWSGLLIEPALNRYLELRANRSPTNSFACAACVPFGYADEFVHLRYGNLMSVAPSLADGLPDVDQHVDAARQHMLDHEEPVSFGALARTLQSLLDEAGSPSRVDFLSLDVEGAEESVLRGVDHDRTRFRLMLVECRDLARLQAFLHSKGYVLRAKLSHHDYLFVDQTAIS